MSSIDVSVTAACGPCLCMERIHTLNTGRAERKCKEDFTKYQMHTESCHQKKMKDFLHKGMKVFFICFCFY